MKKWKIYSLLLVVLMLLLPDLTGINNLMIKAENGVPLPTSNMRTVAEFNPYTLIEDFENEDLKTSCSAGENVSEVSRVNQASDIFFPYEGDNFLRVVSEQNLQNNVWRTVTCDFDTPLDLSNSRYLMMAFDHFGYLPNDEPYYARMKVYSDNSSTEGIVQVYNNQWNKVGIDISEFEDRNSIEKLEISFQHAFDRSDHPDDPLPYWPDTEFFIDYIHAANDLGWQFSYDNDLEGWHFNNTVLSPSVSNGKLTFNITSSPTTMTSSPIRLNAEENNLISLNLKNDTKNTVGKLYWTTKNDSEFNEEKSQLFNLEANDDEMREYVIRLIGHSAWEGEITGIRFQYTGSSADTGMISIDEINFSKQDRPIYDYIGSVSDIRIDEETVTVKGSIEEDNALDAELQLYELAPYHYEQDIDSLTPVQTLHVQPEDQGRFTFNISRFDNQRDRYYSKYLVVLDKTEEDGTEHYIDRPKHVTEINFSAEHQVPYPESLSKKGLNVQMVDDAEELGVSHSTITVVLNGMMYKDDVDPENTIRYEVEGVPYYFNKDKVEQLDRNIKSMSDNGTIVNLVLILYDSDDSDSATDILMHPDAARGQGTVYAFNTTNSIGVNYYKAAMEFLADRYTREDQKYGRAMGYIIGNEVDSAWIWQNMGEKTTDQFVEEYERSVRLAYYAVRKHSNNARVYISLDNAWNEPYQLNQPKRFYKGKDIVDKMNTLSKQGGNYPWHIAHHPYPETFLDPRTWEDHEHVTDNFDTPKITFKNLQVLTRYFDQDSLKIDGERRKIILSEQGFQTEDSSLDSQKLQAAAYAYAYYKSQFLSGIDAFILFNHFDIPSAGFYMGLWETDSNRADYVPEDKKFIYDVFKYIDTERSLEVTDFAKSIIGIEEWSEVIPGFDASQIAQREPHQLVPMSFNKRTPKIIEGDDFEEGKDGWGLAENSIGVEQDTTNAFGGTSSLKITPLNHSELWNVDLSTRWMGAGKKFSEPLDASNMPHLNLAVNLTDPLDAEQYYLKVKVYSGDQVAEGISQLDTEKGWNALSLNLSNWEGIESIDRIKVWTKKTTNQNWVGSLLIDEIGFSKKNEATGGVQNIDIVATTNDKEIEPGTSITVSVTNYDEKKQSGAIKVEPIGDITLSEKNLKLKGLNTGETQQFTFKVKSHTPTNDNVGLRFSYRNIEKEVMFGNE